MQILYTPKEAEDYLLDTAEECRTPTQVGSYDKEEETFPLHDDFNASMKLQTTLDVTDMIKNIEITAEIEVGEEVTGEEAKQLVDGTKRELSHMIKRSFPGHVEVGKEGVSTDNKHEIRYLITF